MTENDERTTEVDDSVRIRKCCASCMHKRLTRTTLRYCNLRDIMVHSSETCEHWAISNLLRKIRKNGLTPDRLTPDPSLSKRGAREPGRRQKRVEDSPPTPLFQRGGEGAGQKRRGKPQRADKGSPERGARPQAGVE